MECFANSKIILHFIRVLNYVLYHGDSAHVLTHLFVHHSFNKHRKDLLRNVCVPPLHLGCALHKVARQPRPLRGSANASASLRATYRTAAIGEAGQGEHCTISGCSSAPPAEL